MTARKSPTYELLVTLGILGFAVGLLAGLNVLISGIPTPGLIAGFVDDWSHHHVSYTNPGTAADALAQGRFEQWYKTVNDPRYIMQEMRRNPLRRAMMSAPDFASRMAFLRAPSEDSFAISNPKRPPRVTMTKDWNVDVGPIGVGSGNFPAKFSFNGGVSCSDIAVFNTSEPGSSTGSKAATVMAITNLYSTCNGGTETVAFAYNTTTGDTVATSVVFNLTGNQIAFISTNSGSAYLNVLRFETGAGNGTTYGSPVTPATVTASAGTFTTCKSVATSCLFRVAFANGDTDTNSSPYYDYASDTLWVGDNSGYIHEFTSVFNGSVAEKVSSGTTPWMSTGASTVLTSPVYDGTYVYAGAANGDMYAFTASSGAKFATSAALTKAGGLGLTDSPLLDVVNSKLYVAVGYDTSGDSGVTQVVTPGLGTVSEVYFGGGSTTIPEYTGTFDNTHYAATGVNTTGYITTCNSFGSAIYFNPIKIAGFVSGTRTVYNGVSGDVYEEVSNTGVACSPQTEILNGSSDYIFLSVATSADQSPTGCTAGSTTACVYSFIVGSATTYTWTTAAAPNAGFQIQPNSGGVYSSTSGIIIDNTAAGGGSNVYFTTNATTNGSPCTSPATAGCAIQVTQSAL